MFMFGSFSCLSNLSLFTSYLIDKIWLQNWLQSKTTSLLNKINITTYFENLTIKLHVLYTFNTHVKFSVNRILLIK